MIESHYPSAEELMRGQRTRNSLLMSLFIATVVLVFGTMGVLMYFTPLSGPAVWVLGTTLFVCLAIPVLVWHNPRIGFYLVLLGVMLFETDPGEARFTNVRVPTMLVPFFWNVSSIGQHFGSHALDPLVFSFGEMLVLLTCVTWLIRSVARREFRLERGAFSVGVMVYMGMVVAGYVHGITSGGNPKIALWEVRGQFYFLAAYLMAANLITERKHIYPILWIAIPCIGIKGLFGSYNYFAWGHNIGDQGVMAHEESLFFNLLFFMVFVLWLSDADKRLKFASLLATAPALLALLANNRRAGIAAFIIGFVPLLPLLWVILEKRRVQIKRFGIAFIVATFIYLPVAWNATGVWALPARAIRSAHDPNKRDTGSDTYRDLEDMNLKLTRDLQPWIGIGYGKPFAMFYAMPDIKYSFRQVMPHNSLLWIWMRLGHVGYFCFWMMVALILIRGVHILKETQDTLLQTMGVLAIVTLLMLITFGKYDLQLVNYRAMLLTGAFVGILSVLRKLDPHAQTITTVEKSPPE